MPNSEELMSLAMAEAEMARYNASPRPGVGCVIQTEGGGELFKGFTQGEIHAEQNALKKAGKLAKGATLFSTLEPCLHKCCPEIISNEIKKVVVGAIDPDKRVSGKGILELESAGIEVESGVLESEITKQLMPYLFKTKHKRPYVVLKLAATLDGKISLDANNRWITGKVARADTHKIRAESDAIIVGANTFQLDKPKLNVRDFTPPNGAKISQPQPIVLTHKPLKTDFFQMAGTPEEILQILFEQDMLQVMIEGGSKVAGAFHQANLIDKYVIYYAPKISGDDTSTPMFEFENALTTTPKAELLSAQVLDGDLKVELAFPKYSAK